MSDIKQSKKILFYLITIFISLLIIETLSFSILLIDDINSGISVVKSLKTRYYQFKDILMSFKPRDKSVTTYGNFDPVLQVRHVPLGKYGSLDINEHGFIGNGHNNSLLNTFPEKPDNLYRIFLLGGSSTAGTGVDLNNQTIAAHLEQLLNQNQLNNQLNNQSNKNITYQVLNFGAAGGYSHAELLKFISMIVYFQPDMIISLDGFNDAWNSVVEHHRIGLNHSMIDWSDYSYQYFEYMGGYEIKPPKILKLLPSSYILMERIADGLNKKNKLALYNSHPWYNQSAYIKSNHPYYENVLKTNLDVLAAYASLNNLQFVAYLQPHAYSGKNLTFNEKEILDKWFFNYKYNHGEFFTKENYLKDMLAAFESYSFVYSDLSDKYKNYSNIEFFDIRNLFDEEKNDTFVDVIHYNENSNVLIAQRYYDDISEKLK